MIAKQQMTGAIVPAAKSTLQSASTMGMIQIDNAVNAPAEPRATKSMENLTCLTIRTGNANCIARFYPALYQLTLIKAGIEEKVDLGFSGSRLLERLVRNPGEVVDRDDLMSHAWSGRVVGQGSLNQQIYTLRQILADESEREIIQTLPRRGYLLNPKYVDISLATTPEAAVSTPAPIAVATPSVPASAHRTPSATRDWRIPALAGLSALIALGAAIAYSLAAETARPAKGKLLTITYAPQHAEELLSLIPHGENIERHLAARVKAPLQIVVGLHEHRLDLVCLRNDGSARTLHIEENHLDQLTDADLVSCLP